MIKLMVNMNRVKAWYQEIVELTEVEAGYTRLAFSDKEEAAHKWLIHKLEAIQCSVKQDRIHNVYGRMGDTTGPSIAFGSHLDTVPDGGLFDGTLGVIAGLECLYMLYEQHVQPDVPLELICFTGEEANILGGTFGSRAIAGLVTFTTEFEQKSRQLGFSKDDLESVRKKKGDFISFLEMHIEQGAVLEQSHQKIGIVEGIAGMIRLDVHLYGKAAHAGTTPMSMRDDALVLAARLVQSVNEWAAEPNSQVVATIGRLQVIPNTPSVVPGEVQLIVEVRGMNWKKVLNLKNRVEEWLLMNGQNQFKTVVEKHPAALSDSVKLEINRATASLSIPFINMVSGANHDTNAMSTLTDTGMIFVPSRGGISHHPDEYTSWEDIKTGIQVMFQSLMNLYEKHLGGRTQNDE
ncbi:hydantoinase/carbamoylase family amidase [Sporolactobacillus shoreicorticis]|uniref:Hydantoinase/carbamoylase family amidase n=1 Tax=Sporolactobacillus shoreicorticis TaxID=1923877 RepID=A0ABW5S378_9BACL|nr:hydantoinase/carbamoylase family amidase [Sporolactobacillus shoreicorticis]MCO7124302.1 hydantoinase/carbamoylase family amidase [Sporolactobacillus shoreicorticis]